MYKLFKINGNTQNFPEFEQFHSLSKEFLPFAQKSLGFDKPVSVNLLSDPQNAKNPLGKTAYYEPEQMKITLFVDKRHVKDILRSMAHELVHHTQNCRGEFKNGFQTGEGYAQEDGHMREMEREAYEKGQMMLRDFEDTRKKKKTQALEEEVAHILKPRPGVVKAACQALNNPKNIERRRSLPDRGVAEIGGTLKQSVNVKSFEHAYQMAQCHRADTFRYRGYKGKKFVNDEFSTDLYDVDPTRGMSDEHFDQMHKAYNRSIRNLEESTLKENQEMSRVNEVSDEVKARTAPKDKANKADFLPKNVRDEITGEEEEESVDEAAFGPNHYCVHHGGVQMEGEIKLGRVINHNWDKSLKEVTKYDMIFENGKIIRNIPFSKILVTEASLANEHMHGKRDDDLEEELVSEADDKETVQKQLAKAEEKCKGATGVKRNMCKQKIDALKRRLQKLDETAMENDHEDDEVMEEIQTEGWNSKKDGLLFERLVKKWTK